MAERVAVPGPLRTRGTVDFLYVMGAGRSGTTLLARMLHAHPDIATTAEMAGLKGLSEKREEYPCSCGSLIGQCPFFQEVFRRVQAGGLPLDLYRWTTVYALEEDVFRHRHPILNRIALRGLRSRTLERIRDSVLAWWPRRTRALDRTHAVIAAYAEVCLDLQQATVFADTSKDPIRAHWLKMNPFLTVRVIHMIRDPRGYCLSQTRGGGRDWSRHARDWVTSLQNCARILSEMRPERTLRLRYEDLAMDPVGELNRMAGFAGLGAHDRYDWNAGGHHLIGNRMRLRPLEEIRVDERWRQELGPADEERIWHIAGRHAEALGYTRSGLASTSPR